MKEPTRLDMGVREPMKSRKSLIFGMDNFNAGIAFI
jgi:hypothetical protein